MCGFDRSCDRPHSKLCRSSRHKWQLLHKDDPSNYFQKLVQLLFMQRSSMRGRGPQVNKVLPFPHPNQFVFPMETPTKFQVMVFTCARSISLALSSMALSCVSKDRISWCLCSPSLTRCPHCSSELDTFDFRLSISVSASRRASAKVNFSAWKIVKLVSH